MHPKGIAACHAADPPRDKSKSIRRFDGIRIGTMTFNKKRAFHIGGASWLFLCAVGNGAMAQDAATPPAATALPEIPVTAPSPIGRQKLAPTRPPGRAARAVPSRNTTPAAQPQPAPVVAPPPPQQGVLPVVT